MTRHQCVDVPSLLQQRPELGPALSHYIRGLNRVERWPVVDRNVVNQIEQNPSMPSPTQQGHNLLAWLGERLHSAGEMIALNERNEGAIVGSRTDDEFRFVVRSLAQQGMLEIPSSGDPLRVTLSFTGWQQSENLRGIEAGSTVAVSVRAGEGQPRRALFLCHASEDKAAVVNPLRSALDQAGISYWYDQAELKWGDSLTAKVNEGLRTSDYVLVVLTLAFLAKPWPRREFDAALNLEASSGEVKVLPLLCGSEEERSRILENLPIINDKLHLTWDGEVQSVIEALRARLH